MATFNAMLEAAKNTTDAVAIHRIYSEAWAKFRGNVKKAQFMSMMNGRAQEAEHYFQNVIPGWEATVNEIAAISKASKAGMTGEEIVAIIEEACTS